MSNSFDSLDDLKTLKLEAAELQQSRKRAGSVKVKEQGRLQGNEATRDPVQEDGDIEAAATSESLDISDHLEMYLKEIEEAALERPMLALLTTFTLGVIVGQLISRR